MFFREHLEAKSVGKGTDQVRPAGSAEPSMRLTGVNERLSFVVARRQRCAISVFPGRNRFVAERDDCGDNHSVRFYIQNSISLTIAAPQRILSIQFNEARAGSSPGLSQIH
jgi:hypothetical protein